MKTLLDSKSKKGLFLGILVGVAAPLIAEYIKKQIKKYEDAKKPKVDSNTDHSFSSWTGDDKFFECGHDHFVNDANSHTHLLPLSSKERMKNYPVFKKYSRFNVSPAKKLKIV